MSRRADHHGGTAAAGGTARVSVVGLGNVLMGDDAFGPMVMKALEAAYEFPPGVTVADLGTPGLDLIPYVTGLDALVIVDTVSSTGSPGELRLYRRDEILRTPPQPRLSPHDPGLKEALLTAEFAGDAPHEVLLVGVIAGEVRTAVGLSEAVRAAVPAAVAEVVQELGRLGVPARARAVPLALDPWWERS
ncbi:MAG TPA: hydrogenase maturation protease [Thermoanaerobaculaceae bacterium]|nr:hydrogenase maturation protease [Thermoanaerobaculaceae bacterium]